MKPVFDYARTDDGAYLGYYTLGDGPIDVVWQPDWPGNIDKEWDDGLGRSWLEALASFSRVISHDHRGVGLSSRNVALPDLETRVSDLLCVLRAVDAHRPVLTGLFASGAVHALLAATRPDLPTALAWMDPMARYGRTEDYPWGPTPQELEAELIDLQRWGTLAYGERFMHEQEAERGNLMPESSAEWVERASRNACTPDVAMELARTWSQIDVRSILPAIQTPTLVLQAAESPGVEQNEYVASLIPNSTIRTVPGRGWTREVMRGMAEEIRSFVGIERSATSLDTILSTVLFTDIVDSTKTQASLGDRRWKELVLAHHAMVREGLERWHGVENDTAGDGFYATFDGPARAIRCAVEVTERVRELGIEVRAGVHTGECEVIESKCGGLTVSIGARVASNAGPSEVMVSQTVMDLVAGSGLTFEDAGEHELKGVPDRWHLYRVVS